MLDEKFFSQDVEIPASVQNKANAAFAEIKGSNNKVVNINSKKSAKSTKTKKHSGFGRGAAFGAVACAAVLVGAYAVKNVETITNPVSIDKLVKTETDKVEGMALSNPFVIKSYACEIGVGKALNLTAKQANGYGSCGIDYDNPDAGTYYSFDLDFEIGGENIKNITYTANNGVLAVCYKEGENIVVDGTKAEGFGNWYYNGTAETYDEELDEKITIPEDYYTKFVVDYNNQKTESSRVELIVSTNGDKELDAKLKDDCVDWESDPNSSESSSGTTDMDRLRSKIDTVNQFLADKYITITVNYEDGTYASQEVEIKSYLQHSTAGGSWDIFVYKIRGDETPLGDAINVTEDMYLDGEPVPDFDYNCLFDAELEKYVAVDKGIRVGDHMKAKVQKYKVIDEKENTLEPIGEPEVRWIWVVEGAQGDEFLPEIQGTKHLARNSERNVAIARVNALLGHEEGQSYSIRFMKDDQIYETQYEILQIRHNGYEDGFLNQ